jgi:16S rRNA (adenine1518-N6/adenine1519-N6)-dimethyltransferase
VPRQTLTYLRELFAKHGIAPKHRYGQNFLIDLNIHELIARTAEVTSDDVVVEVGPGAGALTSLLAEDAHAVIAIEIDPDMARLVSDAIAERPNVRLLNIDALAGKNRLNPQMVEAIQQAREGRRLKLVANLPFNIATPLLSNLLVDDALRPDRMVVTIQRELADRMMAAPANSAYGSLSVLVQALADVELVRVLAPSVFWPRPKVDSAIVLLVPRAEKRAAIADLEWFHAVVRRVFLHRRKNLRGVLATIWPWSKSEVDAFLAEQGLDGQLRAEALNVPEWIALADALKQRVGPLP